MALITTSEKSMFVWWVNPSLCRSAVRSVTCVSVYLHAGRQKIGSQTNAIVLKFDRSKIKEKLMTQ